MAVIHPFRAVLPQPSRAGDIASVPYDVITRNDARSICTSNPESFLHVIRPDADLPDTVDEHADEVYEQGRKAFEAFLRDGILFEDPESAVYVYRIETDGHVQTGVVACCEVAEYRAGTIKRHELTRPEKEDDRVRHMQSLGAQPGPVLMTFRRAEPISRIIATVTAGEPIFSFTVANGERHTVWRVSDPEGLVDSFASVQSIYIADGHHRAASASRVADIFPESKRASRFLSVLFPDSEMKILAYNRHLSVGKSDTRAIVAAIESQFSVSSAEDGTPDEAGEVRFYAEGSWRSIQLAPSNGTRAVDSLDLARFQDQVLEPIAGVEDQRVDPRLSFVGGFGAEGELRARVDREGGVAFSFYPVSVSELVAVSDEGDIMPPKSTWFSPKLRSGLFVHRFRSDG